MTRRNDRERQEDMRCLIGTLSVGENELEACERAIADQDYTNWSHVRFDDLPEYEAHESLYREFMQRIDEFDLFFKIDADMVLYSKGSLRMMVEFLRSRPRVDHACFAVHDYLTDSPLLGLHAFTARAVWGVPADRYRPDENPAIPGERISVRFPPAPVASHAASPSEYQAFHFGAHRAIKALAASDRRARSEQLLVLRNLVRHAQRNTDRRLRFAQLGAWHAWNGDIGRDAHNASSMHKRDIFERYRDQPTEHLEGAVPKSWRREVLRRGLARSWTVDARVVLSTLKDCIRSTWMQTGS